MIGTRVPLLCAHGVTGGTLTWTTLGKVHLTVFAKATFAADAQGTLRRTEPERVVYDDMPYDAQAGRSVRDHGDFVLYLAKTDVVMRGSAHGRGDEVVSVALGLRLGNATFEKRIAARVPAGATSQPLVYEAAFGGADVEANPVGVAQPPVWNPASPRTPAGFAPISREWPARKALLRAGDIQALRKPQMEIPEGFAWEYFHAAPADQRAPLLRGDEVVTIVGCAPGGARAVWQLPGVAGAARVYRFGPDGDPVGAPRQVVLAADTLRIDADRARLTITFRAYFPVANREELDCLAVAAGVATRDERIAWPADDAVVRGRAPTAQGLEGTLPLVGHRPRSRPKFGTLPFRPGEGPAPSERAPPSTSLPGAPWTAASASTLPVAPATAQHVSQTRPTGEEESPLAGTIAAEDPGPPSDALPFTGFAPGDSRRPAASSPMPGAPWGPAAAAVHPPSGFGTLALGTSEPSQERASLREPPSQERASLREPSQERASLREPSHDHAAPLTRSSAPPPAPPRIASAPPAQSSSPSQRASATSAPSARSRGARAPAAPAPAPAPKPPPPPTDADALAARLRAAGASATDIAALARALHPPPAPPDGEDDD